MNIRGMALIAVVPAVFALAACGGESDGDTGIAGAGGAGASASASPKRSMDRKDAELKFAQCMRQNGVDMEDPVDGKITIKGGPGDDKKVQEAQKKCGHFLEAGGGPPDADDPKVRDQMLKFAQCMRQHGADVPDPAPGEGMKIKVEEGQQATFEAAQKACEQLAPGRGTSKGPA